MISRFEFLYLKSQIKKIQSVLDILILGVYDKKDPRYETYRQYLLWKEFNELPWGRQSEIRAMWADYYTQCSRSEAGKRFWQAKDAGMVRDTSKVKDLANEAKLDIELKLTKDIPRPGEFDPDELNRKMRWVTDLQEEKERLVAQYNEYKDVYEKKENQEEFGGKQGMMGAF